MLNDIHIHITMETLLYIAGTTITILLCVIGYFLRMVHTDVKNNTTDIGKLWGRTDLIEQRAEDKIDKLATTTEIQLQHLTEQITRLTVAVEKLIEKNAA